MQQANIFITLAFMACWLSAGSQSEAQCVPVQLHKLLPDNLAADDQFGESVHLDGTIAIVGASVGETFPIGTAYLFDTATGEQINQLFPDDVSNSAEFGRSVRICGNTAIIGDPFADFDGEFAVGRVHLFDVNTGNEFLTLLPGNIANRPVFGFSVSVNETTAIVGAPNWINFGETGVAYIFDLQTGAQSSILLAADGLPDARFGISVDISENMAIVGSRDTEGFGGTAVSGAAYIFDTTTGIQLHKLLPNDGTDDQRFGESVAISGTTAIVGSQKDDNPNGEDAGAAYLFDTTTGQQLFKLIADDGAPNDRFGHSVAIHGDTAVVAAPADDDNGSASGSAYLFDVTTGKQLAKILPDDGEPGGSFGNVFRNQGVAVSDMTVVVGSYFDDNENGEVAGSAYVFDVSCSAVILGDLNGDGIVNLLDVQPFVDLLTSGGFQAEADINQDGVVNLLDVDPFVDLLVGM